MKRFVRLCPQLFLIFLIWMPLSARKCCKVPVAQSQLGCINAELQTILVKVCKIIPLLEGKCDKNVIPIAQTDMPATISSSGHYCLQQDVTTSSDGITITASNVTLDLNGFHITGNASAGNGIVVSGANDVVIFNGTVQSNTTNAATNGHGIRIISSRNVVIDSVLCRSNDQDGFNFPSLFNNHLTFINCRASNNMNSGFFDNVGSSTVIFRNCEATTNGDNGFELRAKNHLLDGCVSNENTTNGLLESGGNTLSIRNSYFEENGRGIRVDSLTNFCIENSTIQGNNGNGIAALGTSSTGLIQNNCVNDNAAIGITLGTAGPTTNIQVIENNVTSNGTGLSTAAGIAIGGPALSTGSPGVGSTGRRHTVILNVAQNNGDSPVGVGVSAARDTNYSNDVVASPLSGGPADNGLVTNVTSTAVRLANLTI